MGSFSDQDWAWLLGGLVRQRYPGGMSLADKRVGCWHSTSALKGMITHKPLQLSPVMLA